MGFKIIKLLKKRCGRGHRMKDRSYLQTSKTENAEDYSARMCLEGNTLVQRLGGKDVVSFIAHKFAQRVEQDETLMAFFPQGTDTTRIVMLHQQKFLSMALSGGVDEYMDVTIKNTHRNLFARGLNASHFDLFVQHLVDAMEALRIKDCLIEEAVDTVAPMRQAFVDGADTCAAFPCK